MVARLANCTAKINSSQCQAVWKFFFTHSNKSVNAFGEPHNLKTSFVVPAFLTPRHICKIMLAPTAVANVVTYRVIAIELAVNITSGFRAIFNLAALKHRIFIIHNTVPQNWNILFIIDFYFFLSYNSDSLGLFQNHYH